MHSTDLHLCKFSLFIWYVPNICALNEQLKAATEWEERAALAEHKAIQHKREANEALEQAKE